MKISETLVKKVQDREACIWYTIGEDNIKDLNVLLRIVYDTEEMHVSGDYKYYFFNPNVLDGFDCSNLLPVGMTPYKLKDFFVEEVEEEVKATPDYTLNSGRIDKTIIVSTIKDVPVDKVEGEASGIKEFDELMVQYRLNKISLIEFASSLWNKGYNEGKKDHSKHSIIN